MKTSVALVVAGILAMLVTRCTSPVAGGTTDTGNARVSAVIYDDQGGRAAGVDVVVCPEGYVTPLRDGAGGERTDTVLTMVTDDEGCFSIDSIVPGTYSIEINDRSSLAVRFYVDVPETDSSIQLQDTMHSYAVIAGDAGAVRDTEIHRYCVVEGLDRLIPVADDGTFRLDDLPAGMLHIRVIADSDEWKMVDFDSVEAHSSDTVRVAVPAPDSVFSTRILLNTTASGANVWETVTAIPVLVRLVDSTFMFSEAAGDGSNIRFLSSDSTPLPFFVETWDSTGGSAAIWVRLDTVYGNDDAQYFLMQWGTFPVAATAGQRPVFDTTDGFIASYHLSGELTDATVNGYDGVDSGSTPVDNGIIGGARSFNGSSQFFTVEGLPDRPQCTFSFWFRPATDFNQSSAETQGIWGKYITDSTDYSISLRGNDYFDALGTSTPGTLTAKRERRSLGGYQSSRRNVFTSGEWYYLAWVWDGSTEHQLYINGVLDYTSADSSVGIYGTAPDEFGRCRYDTQNIPSGPTLYFNGSLDEIRMESEPRSASRVRLCYVNEREEGGLVTVEKPARDTGN